MLKALMLRKKIDVAKKALDAHRSKTEEFEKRQSELETAIQEAETAEEQKVVEEEIETFDQEKADHEAEEKRLEEQIADLEKELEDVEKAEPVPAADPAENRSEEKPMEARKVNFEMKKRFKEWNIEERSAFIQKDEVKDFIQRTRELIASKRSVTGAAYLIPTVVLDLIRENILEYSKLYKHVNVQNVPGVARQTVAGAIPEAVWTEACATLNELNISFGAVEVDGFKVGGYIPVCKALLEDSDEDLLAAIIEYIGAAIGLAIDKAILYGTGTKMPLGVVPRLLMTATSARLGNLVFEDVHTTNVAAISSKTDVALFKAIITAAGAAKGKYSRGGKTWVMNEGTYNTLLANSLSINAAGAVTAGLNGTMPVLGGAIEVLDFVPDNVIVGGYFDLYLLAERAGVAVEESEHVQFIQDNTVVKGTARYDGLPVVGSAFVAIDIAGGTITANAVTFAQDTANA